MVVLAVHLKRQGMPSWPVEGMSDHTRTVVCARQPQPETSTSQAN